MFEIPMYSLKDFEFLPPEPWPEQSEVPTAEIGHCQIRKVDPEAILAGTDKGRRNVNLYSYACSLQSRKTPEAEARVLACEVARRNRPPTPDAEALEMVERVYRKFESNESETKESITTAEILKRCGLLGLKLPCTVTTIEECLRRLAADLKPLDSIARSSLREAVMQHLTALKVKAPAQLLKPVFSSPTEETERIEIASDEAWDQPVDVPALLDRISATLSRFLFLPLGAADTQALWIIFSHAHDAFTVSPILSINSPEKRCGKTANLELTGSMVPKALPAANITAAAMFRAVEKYQPTLLIDEADTFLHNSDELRGVLNSGHRKASAFVIRCCGDDSEPQVFRTWAPKILARIGELPDTLADRSITIRMQRKSKNDQVERLRLDRILPELRDLRRQCARWAKDYLELLRSSDPSVPDGLNDRAADNWRPLLSVADAAGPAWGVRARKALNEITGVNACEYDSIKEQLLSDIRTVFESRGEDAIPSSDLSDALGKIEGHPWGEWGKQRKPITATQVARLLKPFKISPHQVWIAQANHRGYELKDFADTFDRYIPTAKVLDPLGPNNDKGLDPISEVLEDTCLTAQPIPLTPCEQKVLTPLTLQKVGSDAERVRKGSDPAEKDFMEGVRGVFKDLKRGEEEGTL